MGKGIQLFKDSGGNKLFKKYIKTRKVWQYYAKNAEGGVLSPAGLKIMLKRANMKMRVPAKSGIHKSRIPASFIRY